MIASFGWHYDFERAELAPADPIPPFLQPLLERAAGFAGLDAAALEQALLMRYDPGVKIGWHRDRPLFGEVVGVSLGVAAVLRFSQVRWRGVWPSCVAVGAALDLSHEGRGAAWLGA